MTAQDINDRIKEEVRKELTKSIKKVEAYDTKGTTVQPTFLLFYGIFVVFAITKIIAK